MENGRVEEEKPEKIKREGGGGKWSKYVKRYNTKWEEETELKEWIMRVADDDTKVCCKFCMSVMRAHHKDLIMHSKTAKHKKNSAPFASMRKLFQTGK